MRESAVRRTCTIACCWLKPTLIAGDGELELGLCWQFSAGLIGSFSAGRLGLRMSLQGRQWLITSRRAQEPPAPTSPHSFPVLRARSHMSLRRAWGIVSFRQICMK